MILVVLTDAGVLTQPIEATSLVDAGNQVKALYGLGTGTVRLAVLSPSVSGVLTQHPTNPALATLNMTGDAQTQQTIRNNLATFLALPSPTSAQVTAAVRALARLAVSDFSGTG